MTTEDPPSTKVIALPKKVDWMSTLETTYCYCFDSEDAWPHFWWKQGVREGVEVSILQCTRCEAMHIAGFKGEA